MSDVTEILSQIEQGNPSAAGLFNQFDVIAVQQAALYLTGPYAAIQPGEQSGDGQTSVVHNAGSCALSVDTPAGVELTSINVEQGHVWWQLWFAGLWQRGSGWFVRGVHARRPECGRLLGGWR